jgi:hypothetical protein
MPGEEAKDIIILDSSSRGSGTDITDTFDRPLFNTFAAGSFGDLDADGSPDFFTGGAGLRIAVAVLGGYERETFSHQVGAWRTTDGRMFDGFPRRIEDYMFFVNPSVADVTEDGYPEVIVGSGGYYLHAWDACGKEPEGWPKFTGGWITSSAALGDVDGDGKLEVAIANRSGYLFVYRTAGAADGAIGWPEYRHDNRNTGNYEEPLPNGGRKRIAETPQVCPRTVLDAGPDGGAAAPPPDCACHAMRPTGANQVPLALGLLLVLVRRRRVGRAGQGTALS